VALPSRSGATIVTRPSASRTTTVSPLPRRHLKSLLFFSVDMRKVGTDILPIGLATAFPSQVR
jgi:hypothetical protein